MNKPLTVGGDRSICRIGAVVIAGSLAACGNHGKSIIVEREILIPNLEPRVDAITRSRDGGFVVTGIGLGAWVVATDEQGNRLWQYNDPIDDINHAVSESVPQTEYHGAVPMANGNTLLCGGKYKAGGTENLLAILDEHGRIVERRVEVPNDDRSFSYSNFYQCFLWRDGISLLGNANDGRHGYIWLVELDSAGVKRRQTLVDNVPAMAAGTAAGPTFIFTAWDSQDNFRIIRLNGMGETVAKRKLPANS